MKIILLIFGFLLLVGCGPAKVPVIHEYNILVPGYGKMKTNKEGNVLLISMPTAAPGYETANMLYVVQPYHLQSFAVNKWTAPPAALLQSGIARRLRSSGFFAAVVTPPYTGSYDYRLDLQLQILQQEFFEPTSVVRLAILATLVEVDSNRPIGSKRFEVIECAPGNDPYSGVLATNMAATKISDMILKFIKMKINEKS